MLRWFRPKRPEVRKNNRLLPEILTALARQSTLIKSHQDALERQNELIASAQKASFVAMAQTAVILQVLPEIMAHLAKDSEPHPEAMRQVDLFLATANKLVDAQVAELPWAAGGDYAEALRNLRDGARALLPK